MTMATTAATATSNNPIIGLGDQTDDHTNRHADTNIFIELSIVFDNYNVPEKGFRYEV